MAEYIDREVVRERLERVFMLQAQTAKKLVDDIPTADVKPVVHGEWIQKMTSPASCIYVCSVCGIEGFPVQDYCCWCGADMRGCE